MSAPSKHSRIHAIKPKETDEIWGRVVDVFADHDFLVELTHVRADEEDDYEEQERVIGERGTVEVGDYVHVWVRSRDGEGSLHGQMLVEEEEAEAEEEEEEEEEEFDEGEYEEDEEED